MAGAGKRTVAWRSSPAPWQVRPCCVTGQMGSKKTGLSAGTKMPRCGHFMASSPVVGISAGFTYLYLFIYLFTYRQLGYLLLF